MRYKVAELEDQIIATLKADTTNFGGVNVNTFAGQVNPMMFSNPEYMQGFLDLLPFALVSYQGRTARARDSSGKVYLHTVTFRIFVGAMSARTIKEAARSCYDMLAAVYDDLHGKVPRMTTQKLPTYTELSGNVLTSVEATPQGPLAETQGTDEQLVISIPQIVVYRSDYQIGMVA